MSSKLSGKYRFYLLLAGAFLVFIMAFKLAINKTIELKSVSDKIENDLNSAGYAPDKIAGIEKKLVKIESLYGSDFDDLDKLQEKLLQHISFSCKKYDLVLIELPKVHEFKHSDYMIKTFKIVVEGNYTSILRFIFDLEFRPNLGRLSSIRFYIQKDYRNDERKLFAQIIIQNIEL